MKKHFIYYLELFNVRARGTMQGFYVGFFFHKDFGDDCDGTLTLTLTLDFHQALEDLDLY